MKKGSIIFLIFALGIFSHTTHATIASITAEKKEEIAARSLLWMQTLSPVKALVAFEDNKNISPTLYKELIGELFNSSSPFIEHFFYFGAHIGKNLFYRFFNAEYKIDNLLCDLLIFFLCFEGACFSGGFHEKKVMTILQSLIYQPATYFISTEGIRAANIFKQIKNIPFSFSVFLDPPLRFFTGLEPLLVMSGLGAFKEILAPIIACTTITLLFYGIKREVRSFFEGPLRIKLKHQKKRNKDNYEFLKHLVDEYIGRLSEKAETLLESNNQSQDLIVHIKKQQNLLQKWVHINENTVRDFLLSLCEIKRLLEIAKKGLEIIIGK